MSYDGPSRMENCLWLLGRNLVPVNNFFSSASSIKSRFQWVNYSVYLPLWFTSFWNLYPRILQYWKYNTYFGWRMSIILVLRHVTWTTVVNMCMVLFKVLNIGEDEWNQRLWIDEAGSPAGALGQRMEKVLKAHGCDVGTSGRRECKAREVGAWTSSAD